MKSWILHRSLCLSVSLSLSHTHTHTLSLSLCLSLSLSHTHTHTTVAFLNSTELLPGVWKQPSDSTVQSSCCAQGAGLSAFATSSAGHICYPAPSPGPLPGLSPQMGMCTARAWLPRRGLWIAQEGELVLPLLITAGLLSPAKTW